MLRELLIKTRSYRNFDRSERYDASVMKELIELCRFTPSTANRQPVRFSYACDSEKCDRIFPLLAWAGYLSVDKPPRIGNEPTAYILVCWDTDITKEADIDVGICSQTIVLGAMERGIGACMIGSMDKTKIAEIFSLPENIKPRLIIALGKPNEKIMLMDSVNGEIKYYRDANGVHCVPKRPLNEIIV